MKKLFSLIFISVFSLTLMSAHHEGGHEKTAALGEIHENELADLKLDVLKHSDVL